MTSTQTVLYVAMWLFCWVAAAALGQLAIRGWREGGIDGTTSPGRTPPRYRRHEQPVRYWLTLSAHAATALFLFAMPALYWFGD